MAVNSKQQEAATREKVKKEKKVEHQEKRQKVRVRLVPIWLRVLIVIVLLALSIVLGAAFGYGVMGGGDPKEIFEKSTWTHIWSLVNGE